MERKQKFLALFLAGALLLGACSKDASSSVSEASASSFDSSSSISSREEEEKTIDFALPAQYMTKGPTKLHYSDSYFSDSSFSYSPKIAAASLLLSSRSSTALSNQSSGIKHILTRLGFTGFEACGFDGNPEQDSVAYFFARKELSGGDSLVYLGIRSSDYGSEWGGNFEVGPGNGEHLGFQKAADTVFSSLNEYLQKNVSGKAVLWGSGYSRGGSVLNLVGAKVDRAIEESPDSALSKERCFFYCLEPARTVQYDSEEEKKEQKGSKYANIFNVVNVSDIVPSVPMKNLSFTRYGTDHVLNNPYSLYYAETQKEALNQFNALFGTALDSFPYSSWNYFGSETVGTSVYSVQDVRIHPKQGRFLDGLVSALGEGIGDRRTYVSSLQDLLVPLLVSINAKDSTFSANTLSDEADAYFTDEKKSALISAFVSGNGAEMTSLLVPFFEELNPKIPFEPEEQTLREGTKGLVFSLLRVKEIDPSALCTLLGVSSLTEEKMNGISAQSVLMGLVKLAYSHSFETNFAYISAEDPDYASNILPYSSEYYTLVSESAFTGEFYDGNTLVASFKDGLPVETDSSVYYGIEDGKRVVVLPEGGDYSYKGERLEDVVLTRTDLSKDSSDAEIWDSVFGK